MHRLLTGTLLSVLASIPSGLSAQPAALLIRGGQLVDGTGTPPRAADVRISGDTIVEVGEHLAPRAGERVIDTAGRVVSPGFIDMHSHAAGGLDDHPDAASQIRQGITTALVGQDGSGELPVSDFLEHMETVHPAINVLTSVGHGTVRGLVMGGDYRRAATLTEIDAMKVIVERGMKDGAVGLSSGIEYDPGFYATTDELVALASVIKSKWVVAPPTLQRFNGFAAMQIVGSNSPGHSSGQAMAEMQRIVSEDLPPGFGVDWAGQSLQEIRAGAEAPLLFGLSIFVVFLCLAALYESWATPLAVLLLVPVGIIGAIVAAWGTGQSNDVFFKIGLITIIGLAAKNAILIVEFAVLAQQRGVALYDAVMEAARLRLRPILMTSFAFILGVLPLVFSSGAGANARRAIGTGVAGGMLSAAILGVMLAPIFYVSIRRVVGDKLEIPKPESNKPERPVNPYRSSWD